MATEVREELKALLKTVTDQRVAIQLAADAEWPHTEEAHRAVRKEFSLPAQRPAKL